MRGVFNVAAIGMAFLGAAACVTASPSRQPAAPSGDFAAATLGPRGGSSASVNAAAQGRFAGAERLGEAELQRLLPGMRARFVPGPDGRTYRDILFEQYHTRPGSHASSLGEGYNALRIGYPEAERMGSYRIRGDNLCSILILAPGEHCRGLFRLPDGGFALATFEVPDMPAVRIRFEPIR